MTPLNIYLEQLKDKYKDYKFESIPKDQKGIQAQVKKGILKKDGMTKTRWLKEDYEFQPYAMREIIAYEIINYVNKAYKAYGFKTPAMPIPLDFDWEVTNNKIQISTSGFSKPNFSIKKEKIKYKIARKKNIFVNSLIGNPDSHEGNIIYKSIGQNYAIDFAYALHSHISSQVSLNDLDNYFEKINLMYKRDPETLKKQLPAIQKKLFFWVNFLDHNSKNILDILDKTGAEIISKITDTGIEEVFRKELLESRKVLIRNIKDLKEIYSKAYETLETYHKELNDADTATT